VAIVTKLIRRPPLVIVEANDELEMARWCESLWPSEKTSRLRRAVEAEKG
jgi:hypothetical protein